MGAEFCQRLFLHLLRLSYGFIIRFLSLNLLIWYITLIDLHSWDQPNLIMVYELFDVVLNCLLKFCWGIFHLCLSVILGCSFLFSCCLCLVLVSAWWWPCRMSLEVFLPLQFFESFRRTGISSPLNAWQNSAVKPFGPGLLFFGWIFDHSFNFGACNRVVHNFYFFLVQSWKIELF